MKMGKQTPAKRIKTLTKDTTHCFAHTCNGFVDLATFLLNLNHEYVLLGIFTSDFIEKDFEEIKKRFRWHILHNPATNHGESSHQENKVIVQSRRGC